MLRLDSPIINRVPGSSDEPTMTVEGDITSLAGVGPMDAFDLNNYGYLGMDSVGQSGTFYTIMLRFEITDLSSNGLNTFLLGRGEADASNVGLDSRITSNGHLSVRQWSGSTFLSSLGIAAFPAMTVGPTYTLFFTIDVTRGATGKGAFARLYDETGTLLGQAGETAYSGSGQRTMSPHVVVGGSPYFTNSGYTNPDGSDVIIHQVRHYQLSALMSGTVMQEIAAGTDDHFGDALAMWTGDGPLTQVYRASGIYARGVTEGRQSAWLLEIDLGGEVIRVATDEATVTSRDVNDDVLFHTGMDDISVPASVDRLTVAVSAGNRETWGQYRAHFGPIRGRRFRLWRWYEGQILEDSYLVMDGVIDSATWGDPARPDALTMTLSRDARGLAIVYPPPDHIVDDEGWTQNSGKYIDDSLKQQHYPTVIGSPGDSGNGPVSAPPYLGTPAMLVQHKTTEHIVVIAGHHVDATNVRLFNRTQGTRTGDVAVVNTVDEKGNKVAVVDVYNEWTSGNLAIAGDEIYTGWGRGSTYGVGLTHRGQPVLGLGDLLIWGADTLSTAQWDFAEMYARRAGLNRYRIDTYWNTPMLWEDWLQANIMGLFPIEEVQGPRGRFYREVVTEADPNHVQAVLATQGSGAGRKVERISGIVETDGDIVNTLEIDYAARPTTGTARRKLNLGPRKGPVPGPPGGAQLTLNGSNFRAATSATFFGPRYQRLEVPVTWDPVTANLIGRHVMSVSALPGRRATYRGGEDLLDLYEYATVRVRDTSYGANLDDVLGVVEGITIRSDGVDLVVYFPDDPVAGTLT